MAEQAARPSRPSPFRFRFWAAPTPQRSPAPPPAPPQPAIPAQRPLFRPSTSPWQPQPQPQMPRPQAPPPAASTAQPVASALPQPRFVSPVATSPPTSQPMPPASQTLSKDAPQTETQSLEKTTNQTTKVESQSTPNVASSLDIPIMRAISETKADTTEDQKLKTDSERKTEAAEDGRKPETETRAEAAQDKKPETEARAEAAEEEKWKTMVEAKPEALKDEKSKKEEETKSEATEKEKPKMELVETKQEAIEDEHETESETELDATEEGKLIEEPKASAKEIQKEQGDGESISYAESGSKTPPSTDQLTTDQKDVTSSNSNGASDSTSQATLKKSTQEDVVTITDKQDADLVKQPEGEHASNTAEGSMSEGHNSVNHEGAVLIRRGYDHNKDEGPLVINSNEEGGSEGKMYHLRNGTKPIPAFINSNLQTFNNSIVFESFYKENSPGVHLEVYSNPTDPVDPKRTWETFEAHKAEMETTPVQNLMYEPDASLRGIAVESGVSEA